jgi:hypothetical protein
MDDLQWIEIANDSDRPADLSGWTLDEGKIFTFPPGSALPAGGYRIVALDPARFAKVYGEPALGPLKRPLKRGGERIELQDARKKAIDVVRYKDREPWPVSADGYSASAERICPSAPGDVAENWAGSPLPKDKARPAGTPGKRNAAFSAVPLPTIDVVAPAPDDLGPDLPLTAEAEVKSAAAIRTVSLLYRVVAGGVEGKESEIPMTLDSATGRYRAEIPGRKAGDLVRYRIKAVAENGAQRLYPAENDLRPALSSYVHEKWSAAKIPFGFILHGDTKPAPASQGFRGPFPGPPPGGFAPPPGRFGPGSGPPTAGPARQAAPVEPTRRAVPAEPDRQTVPDGDFGGPPPGFFFRGGDEPDAPRPPRGTSAFVYADPQTGKTSLFDFLDIEPRNGGRGYKIHFDKDRPFNDMTAVNVEFEGSERFLLAEYLAYRVYQLAGNAAPWSDFVRLWVDGRMVGYHLMIERINRSFLRKNNVDDKGNLYKLLWYGNGIVGQHEKKTNTQTDHEDLLKLVAALQKTKGEEQWKVIQDNFDVDQVATYFAANMLLSHWDGFFNNYFAYHDTGDTNKWRMYPWDQDKTWGYFDGIEDGDVFFTMPLTFGMNGSRPPGGGFGGDDNGFGGGPFGGGASWWRPPGFFSGPLLANPEFRQIFLARVRDLLARDYTQENFFPLIDATEERLREDVRLRAQLEGRPPQTGEQELEKNAELMKTHLLKRRQYLLAQKGIGGSPQ